MRKIGGLIALVLVALLVIVGCDNSTVTNDGNDEWINHINGIIATQPDTSWFTEGESTSGKTYKLTTANELYGLMELVNGGEEFEGANITLPANAEFDFSQVSESKKGDPSFIGFGSRKYYEDSQFEDSRAFFKGKFNGNGAVIKGVDLSYPEGVKDGTLTEAEESDVAVGFFGVVKGTAAAPAEVRDLVFEDCTLFSTSNTTGIAVGYAENAIISGITVRNCTITGPQGVGGVVGRLYNSGEISDCVVENTSVIASDVDVNYEGPRTGNYNVGGIVGIASYSTRGSSWDVAAPDPEYGAIAIEDNQVTLGNGNKISAADYFAGGICGSTGMKSTNKVTFTGNKVTLNGNASISSSKASGTTDGAGGICGSSSGSDFSGNIVTLNGTSSIEAASKNAGGISGNATATSTFSSNSVVIADKSQISAASAKGAIYGGDASISLASGDNTIKIGNAAEITIDDSANTNAGVLTD